MNMLRISLSIAVVVSLALSLYLAVVLPRLLEADKNAAPAAAAGTAARGSQQAYDANDSGIVSKPAVTVPPVRDNRAGGTRLIEVYGEITDTRGRPVEGVLVTEERFFFAAGSDARGHYRIVLDLPRHRMPVIQYLRAGYASHRVDLAQALSQHEPLYRLDVVLADDSETLRMPGWVANDLGVGLEGVRIEISALESDADRNYYLTVFSDERGNFVLEGVRADTRYKLTATLAPDYPVYSNPDFYIGSEARQLDIVLKTLKFVDLGGMILNPENAPVANFEVYIKNVTTGVHTRKIVSDSSGYFTVEQFPLGEVSLTTRGPEFHKISGLVLTEANYANLVLRADRGDRYLSGWVSDENGVALHKAMVTLDSTLNDGQVEYFSYRSQTTDNSGYFGFQNLAAGDHRLSVYSNGFDKFESRHSLRSQSDQIHIRMTRQD